MGGMQIKTLLDPEHFSGVTAPACFFTSLQLLHRTSKGSSGHICVLMHRVGRHNALFFIDL